MVRGDTWRRRDAVAPPPQRAWWVHHRKVGRPVTRTAWATTAALAPLLEADAALAAAAGDRRVPGLPSLALLPKRLADYAASRPATALAPSVLLAGVCLPPGGPTRARVQAPHWLADGRGRATGTGAALLDVAEATLVVSLSLTAPLRSRREWVRLAAAGEAPDRLACTWWQAAVAAWGPAGSSAKDRDACLRRFARPAVAAGQPRAAAWVEGGEGALAAWVLGAAVGWAERVLSSAALRTVVLHDDGLGSRVAVPVAAVRRWLAAMSELRAAQPSTAALLNPPPLTEQRVQEAQEAQGAQEASA